MSGQPPVDRGVSRFMREPVSVRHAASVIVGATTLVVLASGVAMRLLDHEEYPNVTRGFWWAMQTVTTVGYGDVTPRHLSGRIVAVIVMLWGIAFVSILVASITSAFVARAEREQTAALEGREESQDARLDELAARLERMEGLLRQLVERG
jgi:voltage-gated potassium channel Kch